MVTKKEINELIKQNKVNPEYRILGYYVHKNDKINPYTVMVVIKEPEEEKFHNRLMCYAPIGQHGFIDKGYFNECVKITKQQYIEVSQGIYTPEEYLKTITLPNGFNGHTVECFTHILEVMGSTVKLQVAEYGKEYMIKWYYKDVYYNLVNETV